jgi:hypothetical protein
MGSESPFLDVRGPEGRAFSVEMTSDRMTIGRLGAFNDVALEPDPQQLVSRKTHCAIERKNGAWCVVDSGSVNRTYIRRGDALEPVNGSAPLHDDDAILILGRTAANETPQYWEIVLRDPFKTRRIAWAPLQAFLTYDPVSARMYRVEGPDRKEIHDLRPQEHKLIRYMDERNRAQGGEPVMCTYEEMIGAVWGNAAVHTEAEINHLVWELRKKIEPEPGAPRFLQTVRGLGCRLVTS